MKRLVALAIMVLLGTWATVLACGPDGKCVGKEKASCCMSKASAKKSSCSLKHDAKQAKLEQSAASTENSAAVKADASEKANDHATEPKVDPKR